MDRDGVVEVTVLDAAGPVRGARVQALAIVDDRAYLADSRERDPAGKARLEGLPARRGMDPRERPRARARDVAPRRDRGPRGSSR